MVNTVGFHASWEEGRGGGKWVRRPRYFWKPALAPSQPSVQTAQLYTVIQSEAHPPGEDTQ